MNALASPVRVVVIDSGVHAAHPHVGAVPGGIGFDAAGHPVDDFVDRLGHGTAVLAAIREKAPDAEIHALKIFDRELKTEAGALLAALDWALTAGAQLVNLSLGTSEARHEAALRERVERAVAQGTLIVSALRSPSGPLYLPGCLPGVLPVELDWGCPRKAVRPAVSSEGVWVCRASGYPRPIPGVPPDRNLRGLSFAVANVTGWFAARLTGPGPVRLAAAQRLLLEDSCIEPGRRQGSWGS